MPQQQIIPTWLAWNNANFATESGIQDFRTGQNFPAGGLGLGDYFDATEKEANTASFLQNGLLHSGRYRLVQVDSGATVANVKTGTVGFIRPGQFLQAIAIAVPGTGGTPGTYNILATPGSGAGVGAAIQVVVGPTGGIQSASVLKGGFNYVYAAPTFDLTVTGVTGAVLLSRLNSSPNIVTSSDAGLVPRPVVFLNAITPGNFGFVQELGQATVLCGPTAGSGTQGQGDWVNVTIASGTVTSTPLTGSPLGLTVGKALEPVWANTMLKIYMTNIPVVQD
jgi:hypothetical protein